MANKGAKHYATDKQGCVKIARELCYPYSTIVALKCAETNEEISRIMKEARMNRIDEELNIVGNHDIRTG